MKKLLKILTASVLVVLMAVTAIGCDLFTSSDTIELVNAPMTEWSVKDYDGSDPEGYSLGFLKFTAKVVRGNDSYTIEYNGGSPVITVTGFDITKPGKNRVATVTYNQVDNLATTFTYNVTEYVAGDALNGDGSVENPFQIGFAADFMTIAGDKEAYPWNANYVLVDNIDFSSVDANDYANAMYNNGDGMNFVGTLDGQGYTISNMSMAGIEGWEDGEQTQIGLFYKLAPRAGETTTIKNINFYNCTIGNSSAAGAALLSMGEYASLEAKGDVIIDNVDMDNCHVSAMKNSSLYLGYAAGLHFIFKNCDISANCSVTTTGHSAGTFIGSANYIGYEIVYNDDGTVKKDDKGETVYTRKGGSVSFEACSSAVVLSSSKLAHGFIGNTGSGYTVARSNGSKYTGIIYHTATDEKTKLTDGSFFIAKDLKNTSLDNYTVYNTLVDAAHVGYKAIKNITSITLTKPEAGQPFSVNAVEGGVEYVFSYILHRAGSSYGNSVTVKATNGVATSVSDLGSILHYGKVYDYLKEGYGSDIEAGSLYVHGALSKLSWKTYGKDQAITSATGSAKIVYSVTVLNADGEIIAAGNTEVATPVAWDLTK